KAGERVAVEVERGSAKFVCSERGNGLFVRTPAGDVSATGGTFTVDLQKNEDPIWEGDDAMNRRNLMAMTLAVLAGSVSVNYDGSDFLISAGGSRVFGAEGEKVAKGDPALKGDKGDKEKISFADVPLNDVPAAIKAAAEAM